MLAVATLTGCASIVSHSSSPVTLRSTPDGATITVLDRNGQTVFSGITPTATTLKHSNGFFQRAIYTIKVEKPGFVPQQTSLQANVNGWYWGNLVFGGFIGFLIVDPATGAMYTLPYKDVQINLPQASTWLTPAPDGELQVINLDQVPADLHGQLVRVSQ